MKLIKGKIIKDIPKHLVSHYIALGWKEYKEEKEYKGFKTFESTKDKKNNKL